ncbi:MAG TPA: hypothetical protein DCF49_08865 [Lachnospiraceae bacterium]|jgi:hypothetical protein|nr:hypothetical protein [Lachnospiraceae bacterium]
MNKGTKAVIAGLAFVAGCEIGIAIQLMRMVHKYTIREEAIHEPAPEDPADGESAAEDTESTATTEEKEAESA